MFHDLLDIFYPRNCYSCKDLLLKHEVILCTTCRHEIPLTNYHNDKDNATHRIFFGRVPIEHATSLFRFELKGPVQQLIHHLKYRGRQEIGAHLGQWLGNDLKLIAGYLTVTHVVPVPLHRARQKKRGYNQVTLFGQEIANALGAPYAEKALVKTGKSHTQTTKNRFSRWDGLTTTFTVSNPESYINAHILLVDDVVTTGATLEACAMKFLEIEGTRISIATIAITL